MNASVVIIVLTFVWSGCGTAWTPTEKGAVTGYVVGSGVGAGIGAALEIRRSELSSVDRWELEWGSSRPEAWEPSSTSARCKTTWHG